MLDRAPYGYRFVSRAAGDGVARFEVVENEAAVVRRIFQWIAQERASLAVVCQRLFEVSVPPAFSSDRAVDSPNLTTTGGRPSRALASTTSVRRPGNRPMARIAPSGSPIRDAAPVATKLTAKDSATTCASPASRPGRNWAMRVGRSGKAGDPARGRQHASACQYGCVTKRISREMAGNLAVGERNTARGLGHKETCSSIQHADARWSAPSLADAVGEFGSDRRYGPSWPARYRFVKRPDTVGEFTGLPSRINCCGNSSWCHN